MIRPNPAVLTATASTSMGWTEAGSPASPPPALQLSGQYAYYRAELDAAAYTDEKDYGTQPQPAGSGGAQLGAWSRHPCAPTIITTG